MRYLRRCNMRPITAPHYLRDIFDLLDLNPLSSINKRYINLVIYLDTFDILDRQMTDDREVG